MPCPTCDHTIQNLGTVQRGTFWCPRCGTLSVERDGRLEPEMPAVVRHVRDAGPDMVDSWSWRAAREAAGLGRVPPRKTPPDAAGETPGVLEAQPDARWCPNHKRWTIPVMPDGEYCCAAAFDPNAAPGVRGVAIGKQ